jgi:hypothetical protein
MFRKEILQITPSGGKKSKNKMMAPIMRVNGNEA